MSLKKFETMINTNTVNCSELVHPSYFADEINSSNKDLHWIKNRKIDQLKLTIIVVAILALIFPIYHFFFYSPPIEVIVKGIPVYEDKLLKEESFSYTNEFKQIGFVLRYLIERSKKYDKVIANSNEINPEKVKNLEKNIPFSIARVIVDKANLRPEPSLKSSPLMTVSKGVKLLVTKRDVKWVKVFAPDGGQAWISSKVIEWVMQE